MKRESYKEVNFQPSNAETLKDWSEQFSTSKCGYPKKPIWLVYRYDLNQNKIVEYNISYKTGVGFTVNSIKEIGSYDDFFLGAKGDYFVVKNGKLQYHYFPTEQTTQTETTTE